MPELRRILRVHFDQSKVLACCLKNDVELSRNCEVETHSLLSNKLTGKCSVFLIVFRKRSNYTSHIQKKTDQAVSQFHISSYSSRRRYVFNGDQVQENEGVICAHVLR